MPHGWMFFKKFPEYIPVEDTWSIDIGIKISYSVINDKICIEFLEDPTGKLKGFFKEVGRDGVSKRSGGRIKI